MLQREVCREEAFLCLTRGGPVPDSLSVFTGANLKQLCMRHVLTLQVGYSLSSPHSSGGFTYPRLFFVMLLIFHPITEDLPLAGLSGLCGYTQLAAPTSCSLRTYTISYLCCRNKYLSHVSRD